MAPSPWVRIDNRLIHGQVIEAWLPYTGASVLVVANDEAGDLDALTTADFPTAIVAD